MRIELLPDAPDKSSIHAAGKETDPAFDLAAPTLSGVILVEQAPPAPRAPRFAARPCYSMWNPSASSSASWKGALASTSRNRSSTAARSGSSHRAAPSSASCR